MKVALTQSESARLARRLAEAGFETVACPLVRIEATDGPPIRADAYDWLVLTSRTAVDHLFGRLVGSLPAVAVIGPGTAEALHERGVEPALVARRSTQEGLAAELPRPPGRILFAGAEGARDALVRELGADFIPLYRTVEVQPTRFPAADLVVLASASAARSFAALRLDAPCVAIGPVTSGEGRSLGLDVVTEAETHDLDGLVAAVKLAASRIVSSRS